MEIVYTEHAAKQLRIRKILEIWVEEAVHWPDAIQRDGANYIARKRISNGLIEVVFEKVISGEEKYINIVTIYWR